MTISSPRWTLGGCNLPLDGRRFRRPWGLAVLRVRPSSVTVTPGFAKRRLEIDFRGILDVEPIQLPIGQGVRLRTNDGDWIFYTYDAARLVAELTRQGVAARTEAIRLRYSDLPQ